jgi:hypothetical protein
MTPLLTRELQNLKVSFSRYLHVHLYSVLNRIHRYVPNLALLLCPEIVMNSIRQSREDGSRHFALSFTCPSRLVSA